MLTSNKAFFPKMMDLGSKPRRTCILNQTIRFKTPSGWTFDQGNQGCVSMENDPWVFFPPRPSYVVGSPALPKVLVSIAEVLKNVKGSRDLHTFGNSPKYLNCNSSFYSVSYEVTVVYMALYQCLCHCSFYHPTAV